MLIGEYTHTIDDKNRVSLPSKFRSLMGKKIVITPGLDQCLFAFTTKEWEKIAGKLSENSSMLSSDMRSFTRYMFGGASEVEVDNIGRVLVPDFLKERANLKTKVVLIGVQNRLEIWNEKSWSDYKRQVEKQADSLAEKLSSLGVM
jgi:MraZ protein